PRVPLPLVDDLPVRRDVLAGERADPAVETDMGQPQLCPDRGQRAVPPLDALAAVGDVVVAQRLVEGVDGGRRPLADLAALAVRHGASDSVELMVVVPALF